MQSSGSRNCRSFIPNEILPITRLGQPSDNELNHRAKKERSDNRGRGEGSTSAGESSSLGVSSIVTSSSGGIGSGTGALMTGSGGVTIVSGFSSTSIRSSIRACKPSGSLAVTSMLALPDVPAANNRSSAASTR